MFPFFHFLKHIIVEELIFATNREARSQAQSGSVCLNSVEPVIIETHIIFREFKTRCTFCETNHFLIPHLTSYFTRMYYDSDQILV